MPFSRGGGGGSIWIQANRITAASNTALSVNGGSGVFGSGGGEPGPSGAGGGKVTEEVPARGGVHGGAKWRRGWAGHARPVHHTWRTPPARRPRAFCPSPPPAMPATPLPALLGILLRRELAALRRSVEAYPDDASVWALPPGVPNSAGTLVLHCAGNLRHFLGAVLGGDGYRRDRDAEFARRGVTTWLQKPFDIHELVERVQRLLDDGAG